MSAKASQAAEDRIPTYEESVATSSSLRSSSSGQKTSPLSFQERLRLQRRQRIANILLQHVEPAIAAHLEDASNDMSIILLPSDALESSLFINTSSVTSPTLGKPTSVQRLTSPDFKAAFLTSWVVLQELSDTLIRSMIDPAALPELQASLADLGSSTPSGNVDSSVLPERPEPRSWLKRTFGLPPAGHDPTGQTGKWNLGWRSEENSAMTSRTVATSQVTVTARLADVTFRTESVMGLLESTTVKCLWLDVLVRM